MTDTAVSLNDVADGLTNESVDLRDFAEEPGGAWTPGWYKAETIEGYATQKSGKQFSTEDTVSKNGDSRNLRVCFRITNAKGEQRTIQESFNYRATDFTPQRLAYVKELRVEFKNVKNWPDKDAQRSSLAIAKLSQFQKAIGLDKIEFLNGGVVAAQFVDKKVDVRLVVDDAGYNTINAYDTAGKRTGSNRK